MRFPVLIAALAAAAILAPAQTANPKQAQPKSQKELDAIQAIFQATDLDGRITAAQNLITKFADTEFKATALYIAAESYRSKGDMENMIVFAERTLEADPKFYGAMLQIATGLAQRTREFDLDKEEKLSRAEKLAKQSIEMVSTSPKNNPQIPDDQFEAIKKDFQSQGHEALAAIATVRKKYDVAIEEYKQTLALASQPDPATHVRMGAAYMNLKNYDEAIAAFDKALADANAAPVVKKIALDEKMKAAEAKKAGAPKQ